MRSFKRSSIRATHMKLIRTILTLALPLALLLPMASTPKPSEAPWREGGWMGALAMPRPTLPGQVAQLETAGPIPTDLRLRIYRVEDPEAFLKKTLSQNREDAFQEGSRAASDPLDVLREAVLWGGRRAFVTAHRTATRDLRDAAKQTDRLHSPRSSAGMVREGAALPIQGQKGITFITELVPKVTEEITKSKDSDNSESGDADEAGDRGHLSRVDLPAQGAGLYLIEALRGTEAAYVPWLVTDLALMADEDGGRLRVEAVYANNGATRADVTGSYFESGQTKALQFNSNGLAETGASPGLRRVVLAKAGASFALLAIEGQSAAAPTQRLYAYTERPLYRPGQEVFVKAILRSVENGENHITRGVESLPYKVLDPEDTKVTEGSAKLLNADTATFGATIQLPNAGRLGLYRVVFQAPKGPGQAEFKVEYFVKPAFGVTVETPKSKIGLGDALSFSVKANYFYGAPVRNAKADWFLYKVQQRQSGWVWYGDEDAGPVPELIESGQVDLDEAGEANVGNTAKADSEGVFRMVVKVSDSSGQRNSGQAQVRASKGDLVLLVGADRQVATPGKPFTATSKVLDLDGKEVNDVAVSLRVAKIIAEKTGNYWWMRTTALKPGETVTAGSGPKAKLTVPDGGLYLLVAEAKDRAGRMVSAQRVLTVAGEGTPLPSVPDLKASADKGEYQPGDTARILVQLPRPQLTLHWAIENESLGERRTRMVQGTTAILEVPITAAMQPNAWAVFEVVAEGRRQMVEVPLRVPRLDRRLSVEVRPDKDRYQPGQTMKVAVDIRDSAGKPSAADLSVGVVDEAIYALSQELNPDPVRFFNPTKRHVVVRSGSTDWSFYDILRKQRPVWSLKQTKRGDFKSDDADKVRQNFKDTAHWAPMIAVGADGHGSTELQLPDNLTGWRATALAVTSDTKVGIGRSTKPSSKPLQVMLTLPRTLAVGEEARAIAMVRNLSGKSLQGTIKLEATGGSLKGAAESVFTIADQGEYRFALPLGSDKVGTLAVTARVEGGGLKDAERQKVQVLDPLVPASTSGFIVLNGDSKTINIAVPSKAAGEASLVLTPVGSLEHLMAPSLPYLIGYPYGCVEQTLSSFVPNVLVADLVKRGAMPALDWKQLVDLDRNIRDGVFRVYGYQMSNGGWGWYAPGDFGVDANPHTTGYAIRSFAQMKRMGYEVDDGVYRRGRLAALRLYGEVARQADEKEAPKSEHGKLTDPQGDAAFLLMCLASTDEPIGGMVESAADKVLKGNWKGGHVLAMIALAAAETKHPKTAALMARLEQSAIQRGGLANWGSTPDAWHGYNGGELVPTATALKALCLAKPQSPLIRSGEAFLATQYQGYGWYSTWTTSQVVDLVPYLAKSRALNWAGSDIQASIQGGPSWNFKTIEKPTYKRWGTKEPRPGFYPMETPKAASITASGNGVLVWTYAYQVPGSANAPETAESSSPMRLSLARKMWRLRTPQETGNARQGWVRQPWTGTLKQGEEAWMELELGSSQSADYAVLEVPIPAGLEPTVKLEGFVLEGHGYAENDATTENWVKPRIEVRADKVTFLFPKMWSWYYPKVRILLRAGMAGSYKMRPAKLSLMSNETRWATCDGVALNVTEGGRK